ncbi:hypothetical protein [Brevifollis gellanilyticus]|uniref:DUF4440 domain-containing protein n=1 Tax=Brevifollis gellanilyticus TaxID=748831 RepID=A0A512MC28_9BACT|nr:hypothetical protein [Brevifollis gellanilyticus]GEP44276.1 hypothetical protein BGE01nite_35670 [Brevifollis gellanilyticus]
MKRLHFLCLLAIAPLALLADKPEVPSRVGTTEHFRQLLLATKWAWQNVQAGVPDRECVFMEDGTFRHPNFTAKFKVKDLHTVELHRQGEKKGKAVLTFNESYSAFEAIDFNDKRITGKRL